MTALAAPYADARVRLLALTDGLGRDAFNRKPAPKAWSAGECVVHLNRMAKGYLPLLEEAAALTEPTGEPPFHYGWVARRFVEAVSPGARPMRTARAMEPPPAGGLLSDIDPERALPRFCSDTDRYLAVVEASDGLDLSAIKLRSPFLPVLRLPLGAFLDALGQHALRHVGQAERAVAETSGPGGVRKHAVSAAP